MDGDDDLGREERVMQETDWPHDVPEMQGISKGTGLSGNKNGPYITRGKAEYMGTDAHW